MHTINFIIGEKTVNKLTKNKAWLETYIPEIVKRLEGLGFRVVFDQDDNFDLMHIHIPIPSKPNYHKRGYPIIYHGHATEGSFTVGESTKYLVRKWLQNMAARSDMVICPSISSQEYYRALLPEHHLEQLNYGINLDKYSFREDARAAFREKYGIGEDETVVCCVAGISKRKGIDEFLEVAKQHPDIRFMWVGGDYTTHFAIDLFYKVFARKGDIGIKDIQHMKDTHPNLLLTGYTSDIPAALCASDIFFFPSKHETQGLALVEAAANGRPMVINDLPVFREWLTHGHDCLMGTGVDDFSTHIGTLAGDRSHAEKLGRNALVSARKHHDIDLTARRMAGIYEELISGFRSKL